MSATKTVLTAHEFDNYPFEEDKRYELDEGELIEMTGPHAQSRDRNLVRGTPQPLQEAPAWRSAPLQEPLRAFRQYS
jgi:hypothetical protein